MSKTYRKPKRVPLHKQKTLWFFAAIGGILLVLGMYILVSQRDVAGGMPEIMVDRQMIDMGYQPFEKRVTFSIKVTNTGDGTLRFTEEPYIEVLEGC
ncbi:MAG TPA: hypothetical protein DCE76_11105 [Anaerolineaceae bacterium]|uniref:hypothetical protein n=1 Tax=Bellilinea sp. TaxID=2838785 RepID=UPI000ED3451F|nr:hypothetical protein [Bellilinea sp.]GIV64827.1 MAG: hypothetical protein KatS3mg046_087 [Bellilinea sp.]HAD07692.1 hypothetical protein [Anaerolineaceae bacterium]